MKPLYEMAVMNVRKRFPIAMDARQSSGDARFRGTLRLCLWRKAKEFVVEEDLPQIAQSFEVSWSEQFKPRFIPDLWEVDGANQLIRLFEVEDTHPLTPGKLLLLHDFWWDYDSIGWKVHLYVFDRYGLDCRELDLQSYAYHMLPVIKQNQK